MKRRLNPKSEIIEITKDYWFEQTGEVIDDTESQEIVDNLSQFFRILSDWDRKKRDRVNESIESK